MSIRIHELAKKIGMDNKQLLKLLQGRNFDVKSVSSSIDNISADALVEEFKKPEDSSAPASEAEAAAAASEEAEPTKAKPRKASAPAAAPTPEAAKPEATPTVNLPSGVFVKTPEDIAREKAEKAAAAAAAEAAEKAEKAAARARASAPPPPPAPVAPAPAPVAPKPAVSAPPPVPPIPKPAVRAAPPAAAVISSPPPAPALPIPPVVKRPAAAVSPAPTAAAPARPTPLSAPPVLPAPAPPPVSAPPPVAPPVLGAVAPKPPPISPVPASALAAEDDEIKHIQLKPPIIVRDFAAALGLKPFKLISELNQQGGFASMNSTIEEAVAVAVAEKHNFILEIKHRGEPAEKKAAAQEEVDPEEEEKRNLQPRPPVVCILGHVDHGKTSLLDRIRSANVVSGEAGGITQHIGAYQVERSGRKITFLDTPGHAAFTKMRARGAHVTDVAVLVVAADDGFMPQTDEALKHAQEAGVALIVAINKIDVKGANIDQVKTQMQQRNIAAEDWGGETITVPVSALKGEGVDTLLEMILLQADMLELQANPKAEASGLIVESEIDFGRGPMATVIVQRGTLKVGDALVCGTHFARVRAMFDDQGRNIKEAPPSTPVRVIGWSGTPDSGATFRAVKNAREAENLAEEEQLRLRQVATRAAAAPKEVSVDQLFANIAATQARTLKVILKTDVFGSTEAVRNVLEGIKSDKVSVDIIANEVGLVTKNDVLMASAAKAVVIGFHTKLENGVTSMAKHHGVRIETFELIYELGDKVREMMADLLDPDLKEIKLGGAEVRQVFDLGKGAVAGCLVTDGKVTRNVLARLRRKKSIIHEGRVSTLKRYKDDANEVRAGLECGIKLDEFNGYEVGDIIECYEVQKVRATL
ncbi:translation initiation factor IF-2 [Cephaloticoccus primus]|uniref:Translation initiation factor IF-2 n=1 Tax=Cephaloticoccus primus TaxID=1548207 RepID=A0A139SKN1_9BACT|nr:translation initiation factor IF-2 [Cephaloticoccus primus]KXU35070.1 translation initiation factor IF-2 [Cephaloticoccus primus]